MRASDSGTYYCISRTSSASSYIATSGGSVQASTRITVGKEIMAALLENSWGEPERAPHSRDCIVHVRMYGLSVCGHIPKILNERV